MKLHLGCGKRFIPGFVHIDKANFSHIDFYSDVYNLEMIKDGVCDLIYASHVLEYYDFDEALRVLIESKKKLKSTEEGSCLRLSVPNFDALLKVYKSTDNNIDRIIGPLFGRMIILNEKTGREDYIYHKTVFTKLKLEKLLYEAGFKKVIEYDWRTTIHKDFDDHSQAYFPHMDKENGLMISLNLEAYL
jgi:predicted SAM-dependent methyltransferase